MAESGRVLVEFEILTVDATNGFEDWWLDKIEKECGIRPIIHERLVATEEVGHHVCSMTPSAQVFIVGSELGNYHEFEEAGGNAEVIEQNIEDSYADSGRVCEYYNYYEFWKQDFIERERGGLFSYDHMSFEDAYKLMRDVIYGSNEMDYDDCEWATEDEKKQMEDYWNKEDDCEKATVEAT